nr:right-handed parallel beta-helix repeat-containing protein [Candidatus Sigynarchaeota archaeon]
MKKHVWMKLPILGLLISAIVLIGSAGPLHHHRDGLILPPIVTSMLVNSSFTITGNGDFSTSPIVSSGNGSTSSPWVIESLIYDASGSGKEWFLSIANVTDHFVIKNCILHGNNLDDTGINIENATGSFNITANRIEEFEAAINIEASANMTISNNTCLSQYGNIQVYNSTHVTITDNTCTGMSNWVNGIRIWWSSQIEIRDNTCSDGQHGIDVKYSSVANVENNYCYNNHIGIDIFNSTSITVRANNLIYNYFGLDIQNSDVIQQNNTIVNKKELFTIIATISVIVAMLVAVIVFLAWDKKRNKVPLERDVQILEGTKITGTGDGNTTKIREDMSGKGQTKLDFYVSWMIFKANIKNLSMTGLIGLVLYGIIRLSLLGLGNIIVNTDEYRFLQYARLYDVALFFVDMFMISFFLSPQHVIAHQAMGTGEVVADLKKVTLKFWKSGIGYAFIILLAGTSLFALQINHLADPMPNPAYYIAGYLLHFILMVIFTGVFPIYADTGKFVKSIKLQLKLFRSFWKRFARTWGKYFAIFVVPNAAINIFVMSKTIAVPTYGMLNTASFCLFVFDIIIGLPMMALIAARIYHSLKNQVVNGQGAVVGGVPEGKNDQAASNGAARENHARDDANDG